MIEFLTLFLGALVSGPMEVELMVTGDVGSVQILLDERLVTRLYRPPWKLVVDFGQELIPHELEAVAFTPAGGEVGRARQFVNLAPHQAEISILLDRDPITHRVAVQLSWESLASESEPTAIRAFFDETRIEVFDPRIIPLPPHDPEMLHHFRVELDFSESLSSAAEITFGGGFGDTVSSELTPFPVELQSRKRLPDIKDMQTWFRSGGLPLTVHSTEKGLAEILIVRDPSVEQLLVERNSDRRRVYSSYMLLRKDHRLRFIGVHPNRPRGEDSFIVFPQSENVGATAGGLLEALASAGRTHSPEEQARLADAVAVAGLSAGQTGRRRAVVLITTGETIDASQFAPQQVQRFLGRLGVPLVVWNPITGASEAGPWGSSTNVSTHSLLGSAYKQLSRKLGRQRVVWLDGLHLPQTISLDPAVDEISLVP